MIRYSTYWELINQWNFFLHFTPSMQTRQDTTDLMNRIWIWPKFSGMDLNNMGIDKNKLSTCITRFFKVGWMFALCRWICLVLILVLMFNKLRVLFCLLNIFIARLDTNDYLFLESKINNKKKNLDKKQVNPRNPRKYVYEHELSEFKMNWICNCKIWDGSKTNLLRSDPTPPGPFARSPSVDCMWPWIYLPDYK